LNTGTGDLEITVTGDGEPVLFIDGAFLADTFRPVLMEPRVKAQYRLIAYRRRGYGSSNQPRGIVDVSAQAADCRTVLDHAGVERAHVVGHSYGGAIALQLALDAPAVVHSLALLEAALFVGSSAQAYREALASSGARFRETAAATVVDEFLEARWPGYRTGLEQVLPGAFERAVASADTWFECELPGLLRWQFDEAEARRVPQPTLAVLGGNSELLAPRFRQTYEFLLEWMPNAEGCVLPGASHLMQLEMPGSTAQALAAFWERHTL
jgi:pimeloyl-ACP methyl ester carboxylesterase